jgi:hypothetical protein
VLLELELINQQANARSSPGSTDSIAAERPDRRLWRRAILQRPNRFYRFVPVLF